MSLYHVFVQDQALVSATPQTLWQLRTGATRTIRLREFSVSFSGTNATDVPVKCELLRYSSSGTATSFTILRWNPADPAAISTAATAFTAEPTAAEMVFPFRLTPNGGVLLMQYAQDAAPIVPVSSWLGLRCTAAVAETVTSHVVFEE